MNNVPMVVADGFTNDREEYNDNGLFQPDTQPIFHEGGLFDLQRLPNVFQYAFSFWGIWAYGGAEKSDGDHVLWNGPVNCN